MPQPSPKNSQTIKNVIFTAAYSIILYNALITPIIRIKSLDNKIQEMDISSCQGVVKNILANGAKIEIQSKKCGGTFLAPESELIPSRRIRFETLLKTKSWEGKNTSILYANIFTGWGTDRVIVAMRSDNASFSLKETTHHLETSRNWTTHLIHAFVQISFGIFVYIKLFGRK